MLIALEEKKEMNGIVAHISFFFLYAQEVQGGSQ